jgi:hypothetical protein
LYHSVLVVYFVEPLQHPLYTLSCANFVESLHLLHPLALNLRSPLVCLSIAPLYGLRYSPVLAHFHHRHSGQPHHRPRRTLRPTDHNTVGATADSPVPFSQENPNAASITGPIPIVDFTTLQPLNTAAPIFSPQPVSASLSASDVAAMFRQLRVHTPTPLTPDGQHVADQTAEMFTISLTPARRGGDEASLVLASSSAAGPVEALGTTL